MVYEISLQKKFLALSSSIRNLITKHTLFNYETKKFIFEKNFNLKTQKDG